MSGPSVRTPAVAGTFYPAHGETLASMVDGFVADAASAGARERAAAPGAPEALIVPHAGYVYSGPTAGHAYAALAAAREGVERVVLIGPAHYVPVAGIATTSLGGLATPLGAVPVDDAARSDALDLGVSIDDDAHAPEHSLEVQLPFLQRVLGAFRALPLVVGRTAPEAVASVLDALWGGPDTVVVVSTDLSHYHDYQTARARDRRTADAVVDGRVDSIAGDDACGAPALAGVMLVARRRGLTTRVLDLRSSGDTGGPRERVVGYGAFAVDR